MTKEGGLHFYSMTIAYNFVLKSNIVDFVKVMIRLESLSVRNFGLEKL